MNFLKIKGHCNGFSLIIVIIVMESIRGMAVYFPANEV
jgi:hypothetical protein